MTDARTPSSAAETGDQPNKRPDAAEPSEQSVTKTAKPTGLALMREPFPDNQISKLPKESRAQIDERKANRNSAINCRVCGGWHHKNAVHLDYVGHAALTDRLLDADIEWSWEPMAFGPDGLPAIDHNGGMWIRLTVCGVSRIGYGSADGKTGGDAIKEVIGDALRNAGMRFGAALDLWHKGDLHAPSEAEDAANDQRDVGNAAADHAIASMGMCRTADEFRDFWSKNKDGLKASLPDQHYRRVVDAMKAEAERFAPKSAETPFDEAA